MGRSSWPHAYLGELAAQRIRPSLGHPQEPGQPPRPAELDLVFRSERGAPVNPQPRQPRLARLAASVGLDAHPHLLRHALASAMAANKEPASIIATQLRHADGGALAQRVYVHQLPQTAPRLAGVIEGVFGPTRGMGGRCRLGVGWRGKVEGNLTLEPDLIGQPRAALVLARAVVAGTGFEPV
jgi:hypothetical protein